MHKTVNYILSAATVLSRFTANMASPPHKEATMYYAIMSTLSFHVLATLTLLGTSAVQSLQRGLRRDDQAA